MNILNFSISSACLKFFQENISVETSIGIANALIKDVSGIRCFFEESADFEDFKSAFVLSKDSIEYSDRSEYGDFQTNLDLAIAVTNHLSNRDIKPTVVIEPTCGKGSFIIAALKTFASIERIYGIEIYKPYVWEAKFSILDFFLKNSNANRPDIDIIHCNVFDFDFSLITGEVSAADILVLGNPPWVTNSMLGSLNSFNLPVKSNLKNHKGLDAITGKSNFDIAEYISSMIFSAFQGEEGNVALLVKNSVIKNIVYDQKKNKLKIGCIEKYCINSKKEFDVSVDASLFFCQLNSSPAFECTEFNFYDSSNAILSFGWVGEKFVSNTETYVRSKNIDGICPFEWRQGLKHDCSAVMEFNKVGDYYVNALNEKVELEVDLVYGILKSSDLKGGLIKVPRKYTIVTQKKVGQDTFYIKNIYPKTYKYLFDNQELFKARKSSIYKGKPAFSIFGIGDYSFKPFKIVISGLYKTFHFTLVMPDSCKPIMLDDTCYMLSFDNLDYAVYVFILLNSFAARELLKSITFPDSKRIFTKDVLMRIDLLMLSRQININELRREIEDINELYSLNSNSSHWDSFVNLMKPIKEGQMVMFA